MIQAEAEQKWQEGQRRDRVEQQLDLRGGARRSSRIVLQICCDEWL